MGLQEIAVGGIYWTCPSDAEHVKGVIAARKALQALRHRVHETFFTSRDNHLAITMMFYKGMLAAIPSAFLFGHVLLSQANGFPMLVMLLGTPLFLGLLGATNLATMGYCLAFTIFNILLTMPGNSMDFSFDSFANRAVAVVIGLSCVVMGFRLLPGLGTRLRRRRLINAIFTDIHELSQRSIRDAETRFSGHR